MMASSKKLLFSETYFFRPELLTFKGSSSIVITIFFLLIGIAFITMIGEAIIRQDYSDALQFSVVGFPCIIIGILLFPIFPRKLILTTRALK